MSPDVVLVLLALTLLAALLGWVVPRGSTGQGYGAATAVLLLGAAAALTTLGDVGPLDDLERVLALTLLCAVAAAGGPVVVLVLGLADRRAPPPGDGLASAAGILRGGAWIGALERTAIFVALAAGWPDGLLAVVGLKGLGRYPELRNQDQPGVAERFIVGTFTSVLWAVAGAGLARLLVTAGS